MRFQLSGFVYGHVDAGKYASKVGAMISVVKQADIPVGTDGLQEID